MSRPSSLRRPSAPRIGHKGLKKAFGFDVATEVTTAPRPTGAEWERDMAEKERDGLWLALSGVVTWCEAHGHKPFAVEHGREVLEKTRLRVEECGK